MTEALLLALAIAAVTAAAAFAALWLRAARRDADRLRDLEAEVGRLRAELERASAARRSFFDLVTHELRSPLSAILGYQELLEDGAYGSLDPPAADAVQRIGRSGSHLLHLIDGVVELARIRSGTVQPNIEELDFNALAGVPLENFAASARERGLQPNVRTPPHPIAIRSDPERIVRALDVLLTSAVKYPADKEIDVEVTTDVDGVSVRIAGLEIDAEQDGPSLAARLGMRLTVADSVAQLLGGSLDVQTDTGGTVRALVFRIPDTPAAADPGL